MLLIIIPSSPLLVHLPTLGLAPLCVRPGAGSPLRVLLRGGHDRGHQRLHQAHALVGRDHQERAGVRGLKKKKKKKKRFVRFGSASATPLLTGRPLTNIIFVYTVESGKNGCGGPSFDRQEWGPKNPLPYSPAAGDRDGGPGGRANSGPVINCYPGGPCDHVCARARARSTAW